MSLTEAIDITKLVGIVLMVLIIVSFSLSVYWNIMFLSKSVWTRFSPVKVLIAVACVPFILIYAYQLSKLLSNIPLDVSIVGTLAVRPAITVMGIAQAVASASRYYALIHGGEKWTLRQYKIF